MNHNQAPLFDDLSTLLTKVRVIQDMVGYNSTLQMGQKYQLWLEKFELHIEKLERMLDEDVKRVDNLSKKKRFKV